MKKSILFIVSFLFIISLQAQTWNLVGYGMDGEFEDDLAGTSTSISADGTIVAIGSPENSDVSTNSGQVQVYQNVSGTWVQLGADIEGYTSFDYFGLSVSLSADGSILAVGADQWNGNGSEPGYTCVYQYDSVSATWNIIGEPIIGEGIEDRSGFAVHLNAVGNIVAIGAPNNIGNGAFAGQVRVYQNISGTWTQIGADLDGEDSNDYFGHSVKLNSEGTSLIVGADENNGTSNYAGYARVYTNIGGVWVAKGSRINGDLAGDWFGNKVDINSDGSIIAVSAPQNDNTDTKAGQVKVFQYASSDWQQIGDDLLGWFSNDHFGKSISLNANGSIIAVSADVTSIGSLLGHTKIYQNDSGVWSQIGSEIRGESNYDYDGNQVDLTADGLTLAIGCAYNGGNGYHAGQVRVFNTLLPPTITTQPEDQTNICPNETISFSVSGDYIQAYQWQESIDDGATWNVLANDTTYTGVDTDELFVTGDFTLNNNQYRCLVVNSEGTLLSEEVLLTYDTENPSTPTLVDVTGECTATATAPTTTDNCAGTITGTTTDDLTYTTQGTHVIIWTFDDGNGNSINVNQNVIVDDITNPIAPTLANVTGECTATATTPTTTDNCAGTITGTTTDDLTYTVQGTHVITWTFDDGNGNSINVNQNIIIDDTINPTPPELSDITAECAVTPPIPTTYDNCAGIIEGVTSTVFPITTFGHTSITWVFDDNNGNSISLNQNVFIDDTTNPEIPVLNTVMGECSATVNTPTTNDNCAGTIMGTTTDPLTYTEQGSFIVSWTFDDGNGNSINVNQNVIVEDVTNPTIDCLPDATVNADVSETYTVDGTEFDPLAFADNCEVQSVYNSITSTATLDGTILPAGNSVIYWTVVDMQNNETTCLTEILVNPYIGINDYDKQQTSIFPNPNHGVFSMDLTSFPIVSDSQENIEITIFDGLGKVIFSKKLLNTIVEISLPETQAGVYLVKLENKETIYFHKLIVK